MLHAQKIFGTRVYGLQLNAATGCQHYSSSLDIIALKFRCCGEYFACYECHQALTTHAPQRWRFTELHTPAVLCGKCGHVMQIQHYLDANSHCPACSSPFNPRCGKHWPLYFEV